MMSDHHAEFNFGQEITGLRADANPAEVSHLPSQPFGGFDQRRAGLLHPARHLERPLFCPGTGLAPALDPREARTGVMDDPTACWRRYLVAISALEPDEDEATQALTELVQWLRVGGRPPDGFTTSEIKALVARLW